MRLSCITRILTEMLTKSLNWLRRLFRRGTMAADRPTDWPNLESPGLRWMHNAVEPSPEPPITVHKMAVSANSPATSTIKGQRGRGKGMNIYVITYDRPLGSLRRDVDFLNMIRQLGPRSARIMERTWLVGTNLTPDDIQRILQPFLRGQNDLLLVNQLTYYQGWLPKEIWDWINQVSQEEYTL